MRCASEATSPEIVTRTSPCPGARRACLERLNLLSLRALRPPASGVLDALVLLEAAVAVGKDCGVVNEDVGGAVVRGDEDVPLVSVEPLHGALSHVSFS